MRPRKPRHGIAGACVYSLAVKQAADADLFERAEPI